MSTLQANQLRMFLWCCVIAVALAGCTASDDLNEPVAVAQDTVGEDATPLPLLPPVTALPQNYRSVGELAGRGMFYAASDEPAFRIDDGDHYNGYDGPLVWAKNPKGIRTQGVLYGVENDSVVSAGYLIRQGDLVAGKNFHGLTIREVDFPAAHSLTVDLVEGETEEFNRYLLLLHFRPSEDEVYPMLQTGQFPSVTSLPDEFEVFACDHHPETRFCPGMGRHYTDLTSVSRLPDAAGNEGLVYGEASGKLIFIEYVFNQEDLKAGVSWAAMPLNGLPIPPIDNMHVLHFGEAGSTDGRYTVHMYFLPEEIYLNWETEPEAL